MTDASVQDWCNCQSLDGTGPWHPTDDTPDCPPSVQVQDTPDKFVIYGDWLAVDVGRCTCAAPEYGDQVLHENGCGLEQVVSLAELTYLMRNHHEDWCVFYGGPDPDNAAGLEMRDDYSDAAEHLQWIDAERGRGVAHRPVFHGPWMVVEGGDSRG
jgi:hypothetical protein